MIAIIDYGAGNLKSVKKVLDYLRVKSIITDNEKIISMADKIILPGVGNFGNVMTSLREKGLDKVIINCIARKKPFLGICVGLQVLFEESEERQDAKGLGVFKGKCLRFRKGKVPQIGWNIIKPTKNGAFGEGYAYFVNSYYVKPTDKSIIAATTDYSIEFCSAVQYENITATQFHPEKSGKFGLEVLRRWLAC